MMNDQSSLTAGPGDIPSDQAARSGSRVRRRAFRRLWQRSALGAVVAATGLAALTAGAGAAHADTLPNGSLVQLGQYSIPSTPPAPVTVPDGTPERVCAAEHTGCPGEPH